MGVGSVETGGLRALQAPVDWTCVGSVEVAGGVVKSSVQAVSGQSVSGLAAQDR